MEPNNGEESGLAHGVAERLQRRFGLGAKADVRQALYRRLELAVEVHGQRAYSTIREVAAEAASARRPERYFCSAVIRRLGERGLTPMADL